METQSVESLQEQCCTSISINCECYPESLFEELSQPCLALLVQHLSMYDLLRLEDLLKKRGFDTKTAFYQLNQKLFVSAEGYSIKPTQCPHLLELFPCEHLDWTLSKLLYRRTLAVLIEEHNCPEEKCRELDSEMQGLLIKRNDPLMELFCPPGRTSKEIVQSKISQGINLVENLTTMAAAKIFFINVDVKACKFYLESRFQNILQAVFDSVLMVSLLLKNSVLILEFIRRLRNEAKQLERISIYGIKNTELLQLDAVLSVLSGVPGFYTTPKGQKEREKLERLINTENTNNGVCTGNSLQQADVGTNYILPNPSTSSQDEAESMECDLMDDALLFGTPCPPSKFDSESGISKVDFRFSNLVKIEYYTFVLNHHLRSWLSLQELCLGVQELHPKTVKCLGYLLQRPQLRRFTLSTASIKPAVMEDLLFAVASRRRMNPLEALCFVSLNEKLESMDQLLITDQLITQSEEEIDNFVTQNGSKKLAGLRDFHGTKLLEVSMCVLGACTECMLNQFVARNQALDSLCLSKSISRVMLQTILKTVAATKRPLKNLIIEQWHILQEPSCRAICSALLCSATSLASLNLKGCITVRNAFNYEDLCHAIFACASLRYIDLSDNMLEADGVDLVKNIFKHTSVTELSLKNNDLSKESVLSILQIASEIFTLKRRRPLDILDLRQNLFLEADRVPNRELLHEVSRVILLDYHYVKF